MTSTARLWRVALYNPLSLIASGRLGEVDSLLNADIKGLIGTRLRANRAETYKKQRTGSSLWIHFGYGNGAMTNRSAGVSLGLRGYFKQEHIRDVFAPPAALQGRG